jgi:hypothetical protein
MAWRFHGRARVDPTHPSAFGVCDRCGCWYNLRDLAWQYDWRGPRLTNLRILVCPRCLDKPQPQLRPIVIPQDPTPLMNARPEAFAQDDSGSISAAEASQPPPYVEE